MKSIRKRVKPWRGVYGRLLAWAAHALAEVQLHYLYTLSVWPSERGELNCLTVALSRVLWVMSNRVITNLSQKTYGGNHLFQLLHGNLVQINVTGNRVVSCVCVCVQIHWLCAPEWRGCKFG